MTQSIASEYANTDFDLKSTQPFDQLHRELLVSCSVLHYTKSDDEHWHAIIESDDTSSEAAKNIGQMLHALNTLSASAKSELKQCYLREFNIGFHCGDTWAYVHALPSELVKAIADAGCSIALTLYPMRNPDGSPKGF
ncbi:hypothetical protein [Aeoliella sp. SH292]|uniref:hypothetical protein n=1 Tax=Aeoliella sp. SH292 TaxID=3454464 RepID=UPI003F94F666